MLKNKIVILLLASLLYGLFWGLIYLFISGLHGMTDMFNEDFIFLIASIFGVEITSKFTGFLFSFIDGILFGILAGITLLKIREFNSM